MTTRPADRRFQFKADVTDALGRDAELWVGIENGRAITLTPPGDGFSMSRAQLRDFLTAFGHVSEALRYQAEIAQQDPPRRQT